MAEEALALGNVVDHAATAVHAKYGHAEPGVQQGSGLTRRFSSLRRGRAEETVDLRDHRSALAD
jgi:hypothetical protein